MVLAHGKDHPVLSEITGGFDCSRFDCGDDEEINSFIRNEALDDHQMNLNLTRVLHYPTDARVIGFITMSMGQVRGVLGGAPMRPVGCIHVAYLGIDKEHQGKGWGTALLLYAVSEAVRLSSEIGCRGVALNCRDRRLSWYEDRGFERYGVGKDIGGPLNKMFFDIRGEASERVTEPSEDEGDGGKA